MIMKKIIIFSIILILQVLTCLGQEKSISKKILMPQLVSFLNQQSEIKDYELVGFNKGERELEIYGSMNNYRKDEFIDGVYTFYNSVTHHKTYFLLIDNGEFKILNIATLDGVKKSMTDLIDFCERKKYCGEITNEYVTKLLVTYTKINKKPNNRVDNNCKSGVKDVKDLP